MSQAFRRPYTRRALLGAGVSGSLGIAAFALVGCGDDDDDDTPAATSTASGTGTASAAATGEAKEFPLIAGWYRGQEVRYYDFGMNTMLAGGTTVASAPIWAFITGMDADGNPQFVAGQHNIIDVVPDDNGYSDLWEVNLVTVPEDYEAESITSAAEVMESDYEIAKPGLYVNCPVVPRGSTLEAGEELVQGWYKNEDVFYPDFGMNRPAAIPIWAFITGMDASGAPQFVEGQSNIIDSLPGDDEYSAFWLVNLVTVPDDYEANSITSAEEVTASGYEVTETEILVNCPVVEF